MTLPVYWGRVVQVLKRSMDPYRHARFSCAIIFDLSQSGFEEAKSLMEWFPMHSAMEATNSVIGLDNSVTAERLPLVRFNCPMKFSNYN